MHEDMRRRDFLKRGGAGLLLGFPFLAGCDEKAKPDDPSKAPQSEFLAQARERMREETKPGIILVIPEDVHQAEALGDQLSALIGATDAIKKQDAQPARIKGVGVLPAAGDGVKSAHRLF